MSKQEPMHFEDLEMDELPTRQLVREPAVGSGDRLLDTLPNIALAQSLPEDFPLRTLLTFLPDVKLKQRVNTAAGKALEIDVKGEAGLVSADSALSELRTTIADVEKCFLEPVTLANVLHKRLTGLRADFTVKGSEALQIVGRRIYNERERIRLEAEKERQRLQREADERAKQEAKQAAEEAARRQAPQEIVDRLERQAETATAAPVQSRGAPELTGSTTAQNWKARFKGSDGADPNPMVGDMTTNELDQFQKLISAVARGEEPISSLQPNWSVLNNRAKAEKRAMQVPGLESFDAGSLRARPGARRR